MGVKPIISSDATVIDGSETVRFIRRKNLRDGQGTVITHALRRPIQTIEGTRGKGWAVKNIVHSDGVYAATDMCWSIPFEELTEEPGLGDVIVDSKSQRWTVLEFHAATLKSRWICRARELAIAEGLEDLIIVLRRTEDANGGITWSVEHANLRARIQLDETKVENNDGLLSTKRTVTIFFETEVELDHSRRIRGTNGALYRIVSVAGYPRLGELMTAKCEVVE